MFNFCAVMAAPPIQRVRSHRRRFSPLGNMKVPKPMPPGHHIRLVRCCAFRAMRIPRAAPRSVPADLLALPFGVAGPGADDAFLAAEFVALLGRGVERARNLRFHGIAVGTAGIGHVDRKRGAGCGVLRARTLPYCYVSK